MSSNSLLDTPKTKLINGIVVKKADSNVLS